MKKRCSKRTYNKKQKKLVVLLGAGAALPWNGITSSEIKTLFIDDRTYTTSDGRSIGQYVFNILNEFYGNDDSNFETFIAVLESIQNQILNDSNEGAINIYNTSFSPALLRFQHAIEEIFVNKNDEQKRIYSNALYYHYLNSLIQLIDAYNTKINDEENNQLNKHLLNFTKFFRLNGYSVKFYTTNYDSLIPQVLKKYFKLNEALTYLSAMDQQFDYNLNSFNNAPISHFNLHRSIYLQQKIVGYRYETVYDSYPEQHTTALLLESGNPAELLLFTPIITGYTKTQRMVNKPFSFGFTAFNNDLNSCDSVITIGYSFSDPHINNMLSSFVKWKDATFCHVTFFEGNNYSSISQEYSRIENFITPFSIRDENEVWAHDRNEKKHIFKKGFKIFLENREAWKMSTKRL